MKLVRDYMTTPVIVISPHDSIAYARNLMIRYRIGHLIVVDDLEKPIGVITPSDIASFVFEKAMHRPLDTIKVYEVMKADPIKVSAKTRMREAAEYMYHNRVGCLPIVDEKGRTTGIITKTDMLRFYVDEYSKRHLTKDFMETDVPVAQPTHSINYIMELLLSSKVRRVIIVDKGIVVGIIAPSDLAFYEKTRIQSLRGEKKVERKFQVLDKGRLGPIYKYIMPIAADLMTVNPITLGPEEYLSKAAKMMLENMISSIPITEDNKELLGIVLKYSILEAIVRS